MSRHCEFRFNPIGDDDGKLVAVQSSIDLPFQIKRVYYIFDNKPNTERGFHAHINLKQVLVCISGACEVLVRNSGADSTTYILDDPTRGILIEGLVWREMRRFSPGAVLLVFASENYDEGDYVRDYSTFVSMSQSKRDV